MIRHRLALPDDIATCLPFLAKHPVLGPRYGPSVEQLGKLWRRFLDSDALFSIVSEDGDLGNPRPIWSQIASFISDDFANELVTPPLRWIGPALVDRCLLGPTPVLTNAEVRHANSTEGLNILVWPTSPRADFKEVSELLQGSQSVFFDAYRGFNIKRLQAQASHPMEIVMAVNSGGWCVRGNDSSHFQHFAEPPESIFLQPHMLEVTKEMAAKQPGTWANLFFAYCKPAIGFTRTEQRLLSAALQGGTDEELSDLLGVSLSTVKKVWASVYIRVRSRERFGVRITLDESIDGNRGKQKKQKLLVYLRHHQEELRPYSLTMLENRL
jgi:DNA-binding CsgD family transcriptional regulator